MKHLLSIFKLLEARSQREVRGSEPLADMSSLAAAQADGYYHPPEWDPQKGSLRKFTKSKGSNQYEQSGVIRFELPYNCWCLKCETHIGKGVRFNAKKVQAGSYFTTKIWEFHMKCATCKNNLVIRTDPKNCDYEFVEGIRRKEQGYDLEDIGLQELPTVCSADAVQVDALANLEKAKDDRQKALTQAERMLQLQELKAQTEQYNYHVNAALRKKFRVEKKAMATVAAESEAKGLIFDLLPEDAKDAEAAANVSFSKAREANRGKNSNAKFAKIMASSIFGGEASGGGREASAGAIVVRGRPQASGQSSALEQLAVKRAKLGLKSKDFKVTLLQQKARDNAPVLLGKKRKAT